jgi:hypothetical protein
MENEEEQVITQIKEQAPGAKLAFHNHQPPSARTRTNLTLIPSRTLLVRHPRRRHNLAIPPPRAHTLHLPLRITMANIAIFAP